MQPLPISLPSVAWFRTALSFLLLAALLGTLLRYMAIGEASMLEYKHVLHAHSHVAMLGWGFLAVSGGFVFLSGLVTDWRPYRWVLLLNVLATVGMAPAFVWQGYGPVSIAFSTLHLVAAYGFAIRFLRDSRLAPVSAGRSLARWAVRWMVVSTLGLWAIGPSAVALGKDHAAYFGSIQFFLHFQFSGWFTYSTLAVLYFTLKPALRLPAWAFILLQISLLCTATLPLAWRLNESWLYGIHSIGVVLQAVAFAYFLWPLFRALRGFAGRLVAFGMGSLAVKAVMQLLLAYPALAHESMGVRHWVIGVIHLALLGFMTLSFLGLMRRQGLLRNDDMTNVALVLLVSGFVLSEMLLFAQGFMQWNQMGHWPHFSEVLFGVTALLPLAVLLLISSQFFHIRPVYVLLPLLLMSLFAGILGGWVRMGWGFSFPPAAVHHGALMVGGFLGGLICLERMVTMLHRAWLFFPLAAGLSLVAFLPGAPTVALILQTTASVGLVAFYFVQMRKHHERYWLILLLGSVFWLSGNVRLLQTGFIPGMVNWWIGFILFTVLGERLELSRFVPVPPRARTVLWGLIGLLALTFFLPFHGLGPIAYGSVLVLVTLWFVRYDIARRSVKKGGQFRYIATSMIMAYGWLGIHALIALFAGAHPLHYDLYLHTFFLGFAFSMIWAHAPIILPAVLKFTASPYHRSLWIVWFLFQLTLAARVVATFMQSPDLRLMSGVANGVSIVLMFGALGFWMWRKNR